MSVFCLFIVGCAADDTQKDTAESTTQESTGAEATAALQTDASPLGKWTVAQALFYGEPAEDRVGVQVVIKDDGTADWPRYGQDETIEFVLADANPDGSIPFTTANSEDQIPNGGAGPRNGLLRILESGEMEMIEATSAGEPRPPNFSEETQKNAIHLRLKRI